METGVTVGITIAAVLVAITVYTIYVAFGPPAKTLRDPFEEHED